MNNVVAEGTERTSASGSIELVIEPRERDLGGFSVRRVLPSRQRRMVGPFAFFKHFPALDIPELDVAGARVRVIMGEAYGQTSPVTSYSPTVYLEYRIPEGAVTTLPESYPELAAYVVAGNVRIDRHTVTSGVMAVARSEATVRLEADTDSHVLVIGGAPLGERDIWWNFVASSTERIEKAKVEWKEGHFEQVPGQKEFIPLPD
jgi:redox-sensitive bicupin YhaK (pirin superfamily)